MKIGAQRLVAALEAGLRRGQQDPVSSLPIVTITGSVAEDLLVIMRSAARQDERGTATARDGYMVVAWLRHEASSYKGLAAEQPAGPHRATAEAFAGTCQLISDDMGRALKIGSGTPIDPKMPRRWLRRPVGRPADETQYGTFFPSTLRSVDDHGNHSIGRPKDVEWVDPEPERD